MIFVYQGYFSLTGYQRSRPLNTRSPYNKSEKRAIMNRYINVLLQAQEMELALKVNDVLHKNTDTEKSEKKLKNDIAGLKESLPSNIQTELERIAIRYDLYVVPMVNDCCTGCFMKLPVGIVNNVQNTANCIACPNCHRFLFEDDKPIDRPDKPPQYKGIARFSSPILMFSELKNNTHAEVIEEMAQKMAEAGFVEDGKAFSTALLQREALSSTSVGSGIAFPHARGIRACGLTLAVGIAPEGIDFGNCDKVKLIFVSAVPTQASVFYMEMISKVARYFSKNENIGKIASCTTPEEMWKIIVKIGR